MIERRIARWMLSECVWDMVVRM